MSLAGTLKKLLASAGKLDQLNTKLESQAVLTGRLIAQLNKSREKEILGNIQLAEFKVFSQWGDDGIIQFLISYLDIPPQAEKFVEFGVENYTEANTRFLLINNNWQGLIMDGSEQNMSEVKQDDIYWRYQLEAKPAFVTRENINDLLKESGMTGEIGLLHIDIDGNDYFVWQAIDVISPIIVIVEYNSVFGYDKPWSISYNKDFVRTKAHYSNLYWGSSLLSLCDLAGEKGYDFIGCNSNGNNAFFVKKDKMKELKPLSAAEGFVSSKFRESRNRQGQLTFLAGPERLQAIKGLEIYNTRTQQVEMV
jgi:hypothetical protein